MTHLCLTLKTDRIFPFYEILQRGFLLKVRVGSSIRMLLCDQLGLSPEYIEDSIKTLFLNGKPVDDLDAAIVRDGATLALSAAMPGLLGATMRRGGVCAPLRSQITYHEEGESAPCREGTVTLKLFNLLADELGPGFLDRGILMKKEDLEDFLSHQPADFGANCKRITLDGEETDPDGIGKMNWSDKSPLVEFRVRSGGKMSGKFCSATNLPVPE